MSSSHTGLAPEIDRAAQILEQDVPDGNSEAPPTTLADLVRIADEEAEFQSAVRGPIVVPEWKGMHIYYRRLDGTRQKEVVKAYIEWGRADWAIFAERALDADGKRLFPKSLKMYERNLLAWNQEAIGRVVQEMSDGSKTQLSDADLGNS